MLRRLALVINHCATHAALSMGKSLYFICSPLESSLALSLAVVIMCHLARNMIDDILKLTTCYVTRSSKRCGNNAVTAVR